MTDAPPTLTKMRLCESAFPPAEKNVETAGLGFGMLRIDVDYGPHRSAVEAALRAGVRVFDLGSMERTDRSSSAWKKFKFVREIFKDCQFPETLEFLIRGDLGQAALFQEWQALGKDNDHGRSELTPVFTYLVADPEFAIRQAADQEHAALELYEKLTSEFKFLEGLAEAGIIRDYGVASAGFTYAKEDPYFLSLFALYHGEEGSAHSALKSHTPFPHFRAVEFPFNLYESSAYQFENQSDGQSNFTLLKAAAKCGFRTYARRPLDALTNTQLLRFISYPDHHRLDLDAAVMRTFQVALAAELEVGKEIEESKSPAWAHRLKNSLKQITDPEQWKEIRRRRIDRDLEIIYASPSEPSRKMDHYLSAMEALLLAIQLWCEKKGAERNERIRAKIVSAAPASRGSANGKPWSLAETAFHLYRSVPHLDCVLVGMRSPKYVEMALGIFSLGEKPLDPDVLGRAFEAAHSAIHASLEIAENPSHPEMLS
ncbi:MAG: hypothetical protein H7301_14395 [Cryobacterium sp.]|nr:hypothetical protein [Oligoflexia bacterium]